MPRPCTQDDCVGFLYARGLCKKHYRRLLAHGDPRQTHRYEGTCCSIEGCDRVAAARTWCKLHYRRWKRNGDPVALTDFFSRTLEQRFWQYVTASPDGCWLWSGARSSGYGFFDRTVAHRFAYLSMVGEIPEGLQLDHLCRNRLCVNPSHLDPVTPLVNNRRRSAAATK